MTDYEIVIAKLIELKIPHTVRRYRPDTLNHFIVTLTGTRRYDGTTDNEQLVFSRYGVLYVQSTLFSTPLWS